MQPTDSGTQPPRQALHPLAPLPPTPAGRAWARGRLPGAGAQLAAPARCTPARPAAGGGHGTPAASPQTPRCSQEKGLQLAASRLWHHQGQQRASVLHSHTAPTTIQQFGETCGRGALYRRAVEARIKAARSLGQGTCWQAACKKWAGSDRRARRNRFEARQAAAPRRSRRRRPRSGQRPRLTPSRVGRPGRFPFPVRR